MKIYMGFQVHDQPLKVWRTDSDRESSTLIAGIKKYNGKPVVVVVNRGQREQFKGKDWGSLDVVHVCSVRNDSMAHYQIRDLVTGECYKRSGDELASNGLHVGLYPHAVQILAITKCGRSCECV